MPLGAAAAAILPPSYITLCTHHVIWLTNECIFFKIARGGKSTLKSAKANGAITIVIQWEASLVWVSLVALVFCIEHLVFCMGGFVILRPYKILDIPYKIRELPN